MPSLSRVFARWRHVGDDATLVLAVMAVEILI
jgi:hypothetical protein